MQFAKPDLTALEQYDALIEALDECAKSERIDRMRHLCRTDLFFLVRYVVQPAGFASPVLLRALPGTSGRA